MSYVEWVYAPAGVTPPAPLVVLTATLPAGYQGVAYAVALEAQGGTAPYTWSLVAPNNVLPAGLALNATTGQITGTPTATGVFPVMVRATDAAAATDDAGVLTLQVDAAPSVLTVTTVSLPSATRGSAYAAVLAAVGGLAPYTWALVAPTNVLPAGLTLNPSTGVISGVPTAAGTASIRPRATDAAAAVDDGGLLALVVAEVSALTITTPAGLPPAEVSSAYAVQFAASGGYGAKTWAVIAGSLPAWASLTAAGLLTGTPTAEGTASFTLRATDTEARTADRAFSLLVVAEGAAEGPHDYFLELLAKPEIAGAPNVGSWTMRDSASLDAMLSAWPSSIWSYVFGGDDYADGQDGVRFVCPHSLSTGDQPTVNLPGRPATGRVLITLDTYFGVEMFASLVLPVTLLNWKFNQVEMYRLAGAGLYVEPRILFSNARGSQYIGERDLRTYSMGGNEPFEGQYQDFGLERHTPYAPTGPGAEPSGTFFQRHSVWCRDWYELLLDQPGTTFTDWNTAYPSAMPFGTANILSAVVDGADTLLTMDAGEVTIGPPNQRQITSWWINQFTSPASCRLTVAGNSNPALNGVWEVRVEGNQLLRIVGTALSGSGGTASKHFTRFTWWHMEEGGNLTRLIYRIPLAQVGNNELRVFRVEMNTSKGIEELQGFFITAPPTQANSTVLTVEAHDLVSGQRVWVAESDVIPRGSYVATVLSPTQISLPVAVTAASVMTPEPRPAIQRINLGDAGSGDTFLLNFSGTVTGTITHNGGDMTTLLREALAAATSPLRSATVAAAGGAVYDVTIQTTKTSLLQVQTPVGFTPGATTVVQTPIGGGYYAGTYGRVVKPLRGYIRNLAILRDFTTPDESDFTFFRAPVR
jgi:hypothetical protein